MIVQGPWQIEATGFPASIVLREMDNKRMLGRLIDQWRYATLEEARAGHKLAVAAVEKGEIGE